MDFVKFYIVQLIKNAASRIRLIDKEKEKLLSRLVARIENSQELFPDLKMMERVVELEEAASKLISIYRRLNKSHIDLEKLSYQFTSDRDAIQSILRRFIQGNFRNGIIQKKRPKIVFDDTTFTIYELKEPEEVEATDKTAEIELKPKIDLMEFLKFNKEEIVSIKSETFSDQIEISTQNKSDKDKGNTGNNITQEADEKSEFSGRENLEINNGIAAKSLSKTGDEKTEKMEEDLVLPIEFEWKEKIEEQSSEEKDIKYPSIEKDKLNTNESSKEDEKSQEVISETEVTNESQIDEKEKEENESVETSKVTEKGTEKEDQTSQDFESPDETRIKDQLMKKLNEENDDLYLDFEKMLLDNILEVDEFLNKVINQKIDDEQFLKLIQKAYRSFQLAEELNFTLISELIKVYWLSLVAIRDNNLKPSKSIADLIRSTLIILVTLIKQREVDLEPFMQKHNQLKEKLKSLDYEV